MDAEADFRKLGMRLRIPRAGGNHVQHSPVQRQQIACSSATVDEVRVARTAAPSRAGIADESLDALD